MINETDRGLAPAPELNFSVGSPANDARAQLHSLVSDVFLIETEEWTPSAPIMASYEGRLMIDSETAYTMLDDKLKPLNYIPVFSETKGKQFVRILKGRVTPRPRAWWPNLALLALTILSVLFVGASQERGGIQTMGDLLRGGPYAFGILLILGSHELGHYFSARRHKVAVSLPYFIPMPILGSFGTMGAFIQLREPMRNRKVLLDVGAAGPLIGLLFAIPVLLIGLKTSPVLPSTATQLFMLQHTTGGGYVQEGNSIIYAASKLIVFGRFLPDGMSDVFVNQLAWAGWTGLLITGLNLIPLGQLDGGHTIYALLGDRAKRLFFPVIAGMAFLAVFFQEWALYIILLIFLGQFYAAPLDGITRLNPTRRRLAIFTLIVFVLVFTPIPLQIYEMGGWMGR